MKKYILNLVTWIFTLLVLGFSLFISFATLPIVILFHFTLASVFFLFAIKIHYLINNDWVAVPINIGMLVAIYYAMKFFRKTLQNIIEIDEEYIDHKDIDTNK